MKRESFYKNKYLIALYDSEDYPVIIADNVKELSNLTGKKSKSLYSALARNVKGFNINGQRYQVYLIPIKEEEKNMQEQKIEVKLTLLQIEIINHLISNELIVNKNTIGILLTQNKATTPETIKVVETQSSQLKVLQKILKRAVK